MKLFVDTWGWLALEDQRDAGHVAAARCYQERTKSAGRIVTSNFVLDETLTLLFRRRPFEEAWQFASALLKSPSISIELVTDARFRRALELRRRYADKPAISFTDLSSMVIMQDLKLSDVMTADRHFSQLGLGFRVFPA